MPAAALRSSSSMKGVTRWRRVTRSVLALASSTSSCGERSSLAACGWPIASRRCTSAFSAATAAGTCSTVMMPVGLAGLPMI